MDMEEVNRGPDHDEAYSLLHWCARRHRAPLDVIAVVLANSPQIAFQQGGELGLTPMDMLLDPFTPYPRLDVARLSASTACPDAINYLFENGNTLLHFTFEEWTNFIYGHVQARFDSTPRDARDYVAMIRYLLGRKPELARIANEQLITPLHLACEFGYQFLPGQGHHDAAYTRTIDSMPQCRI
jgi:hypothetical protein